MSPDSKAVNEAEATESVEHPIEDLMSAAETGGAAVADAVDRTEDGDESPPTSESVATTSERRFAPGQVDRFLQLLLFANLAFIGVVLIMPSSGGAPEPTTEPPASELAQEPADPFVTEARKIGDVPSDQLWEQAVREAGRGEYPRAIRLLESYLESDQGMTDVEKRLIYNQLAYYLVKDGRVPRAQEYERKSQQIMTRSYLPEDLLNGAHKAAEAGETAAMRSAYARFLLQQKQVPPTLRKFIAEAYLELGNSYRLEAEQGEAQAADRALESRPATPGQQEGHR